jgi:Arylsulfatase A and related enzymes
MFRKNSIMKKKNIIYVLSDQHNPAVTGALGDPYVRTPNIDSLYRLGTSLDSCYCAAPLCVPSRSSLLTGQLPSHNGVYNNMQSLRSDKATLPTVLTVSGYETVLSGRMHFVGWDQRHGFEKRFVGDITPCFIGGDNETEVYGDFKRSSGQNQISIHKSGSGHSAVLDFDQDVVDAACKYLRNRTDERPLFMTVGLYGPHCPYIAPKELYDFYYNLLPEIDYPDEEAKN